MLRLILISILLISAPVFSKDKCKGSAVDRPFIELRKIKEFIDPTPTPAPPNTSTTLG